MSNTTPPKVLPIRTGLLTCILLICLAGIAAADDYVGGIPLTTVQTGTVTGDLWFDAAPAPNWGANIVTKTFYLPAEAVAEPGRITWARLYISAYCGHMQEPKTFCITNKFDGNGDGSYETTWAEPGTSSPYEDLPVSFVYIYNGGNDNSAFPGHGTGEPYKMINDHMNRVTSDYFMWYDVTDLVTSQTVNVSVDTTGSFDGRIKVITLVVAYDDPASTTRTTYWVNQGHDVCSYYTEDFLGKAAVGSTTFSTSGPSGTGSAVLTIDYMASNNGYYGFPTAENDFEYTGGTPPVEGTFTNAELDRDPDVQGAYSGVDSWDVTSSIDGSSDVALAYARYFPGTGTAAFFKIPLAFLVAKSPFPPVADFAADKTSGAAPLTVQFTDSSANTPTSWAWDFDCDGNVDSTDPNPGYTYDDAGTYSVKLTVTNAGGSDEEVKTNYITVTIAPPTANFSATPTNGAAPLTVQFTDTSTNTPTSWAWDFDNNGIVDSTARNPGHTYDTEGTYTVKLTASNAGGSDDEVRTGYITVDAALQIDLTISGIVNPVPAGAVFARETNRVRVAGVENQGADTATDIVVALYASDVGTTEPVNTTTIDSLESGAATDVIITDPTVRDLEGGTITYTAIADPDNLIAETDEDNNEKTSAARSVVYNGYKGKQYWEGGSDVTTDTTYDIRGDLIHSFGDGAYVSGSFGDGGWTTYDTGWTAADLPIPQGATVLEARLYVPYTWDNSGEADSVTIDFNGVRVDRRNRYTDQSNFGGYADYVYGLMTYDVTARFLPNADNTATFTRTDSDAKISPYGFTLAVVYEDDNATRKQIFINEEFDLLGASQSDYGTTPEEATAYVPFTGMTILPSGVSRATLTTFVPSGYGPEGTLLFNDNVVATSVWDHGTASGPQVAVDTRDVTAYLESTGNVAGIQGDSDSGSTPCLAASQQFLVVEYIETSVPIADFSANTVTPVVGQTVTFTDLSAGYPTSWEWDFNNDGTVDSTEQNPGYAYPMVGTYTVKLTATNDNGSDEKTKTDYIVVTVPPPVAAFGATPLNGTAPLTVDFTDQSTNTPTSWAWDFGDNDTANATVQNPVHTYTSAGTYTVKLTATNAGGSDDEVKTGYITAASASAAPVANFSASPTSGTAPLTVQFTDTSTNNPTSWAWDFDNNGIVDSTARNPSYIYSISDSYTVKLTATNADGSDEEVKTGYITAASASAAPVAAFTASPTSGTTPLEVEFTDKSTNSPTSWLWVFGDGGTSDDRNPSHTYDSEGTYTVKLTATNFYGSGAKTITDYITVTTSSGGGSGEPTASFSATPTSGTAPLTVTFTDTSTGSITSWAWDFDNDGEDESTNKDPTYTYTTAGKYSVMLTVTGSDGSDDEVKADYITVTEEGDFDLTPVLVIPNAANVFANEPNKVQVNVKNNGPETSSATEVLLTSSDGVEARASVPEIESGETVVVQVTDPMERSSQGASITYTAVVDPDNLVSETDETNNEKSSVAKTVKYNGYKGKRYWTGGSDITTEHTFDLNGSLIYSRGDSEYRSGSFGDGGWLDYTVTWYSGDLEVPDDATVKAAYLYVPYTWDNENIAPDHTFVDFNGYRVSRSSWYWDVSNFGAYIDHRYGLITYDVTSYFEKNEDNEVLFTRENPKYSDEAEAAIYTKLSMYEFFLVVIYEDEDETEKQIFINEGFDLLGASAAYGTTPEESTAYIPFTDMTIDVDRMSSATLITFVPSGDSNEGNLLYDDKIIVSNVWAFGASGTGIDGGHQVADDTRDVTSYIKATGNTFAIQSTDLGDTATPCMAAIQQILIVDLGGSGTSSTGAKSAVTATAISTAAASSNSFSGRNSGSTAGSAGQESVQSDGAGDTSGNDSKGTGSLDLASLAVICGIVLIGGGVAGGGVAILYCRGGLSCINFSNRSLILIVIVIGTIVFAGVAGTSGLISSISFESSGSPAVDDVSATANFDLIPTIENIKDLDTTNHAPDYPGGFSARNGLLFINNGASAYAVSDLELVLSIGADTITIDSLTVPPPDSAVGSISTYFEEMGDGDGMLGPGEWLMVYADNCYDSSAADSDPKGKVLAWEPQGSGPGVEVPVKDTFRYSLKNKADGTVLKAGTLAFVPETT